MRRAEAGRDTHDRSATVTGPVGAVPKVRAVTELADGRRLRSARRRAISCAASRRVAHGASMTVFGTYAWSLTALSRNILAQSPGARRAPLARPSPRQLFSCEGLDRNRRPRRSHFAHARFVASCEVDHVGAARRSPPRNPAALAEAQSASEMFDVMHPPDPDFDIYKDKGVPTGETKPRGLVHRDRDWHRSVHVWLVDVVRQTVALQKRSPAKDTFPDRYDISAAGHIEAGGDSRDTAARELVEELGVTLAPDSLDFCFTVPAEQAGIGGCNCFEDVYVAKMDAASVDFAVGEAEVTEATWWTIANSSANFERQI